MKISSGQEYAAKIINTKKLSARGRKQKDEYVQKYTQGKNTTHEQENTPLVSLGYVWMSCELLLLKQALRLGIRLCLCQ